MHRVYYSSKRCNGSALLAIDPATEVRIFPSCSHSCDLSVVTAFYGSFCNIIVNDSESSSGERKIISRCKRARKFGRGIGRVSIDGTTALDREIWKAGLFRLDGTSQQSWT